MEEIDEISTEDMAGNLKGDQATLDALVTEVVKNKKKIRLFVPDARTGIPHSKAGIPHSKTGIPHEVIITANVVEEDDD